MSTTIAVEDKGQWVPYQLPAQSSCGTLLCACALMALNIPLGIGPKLEDPGWGSLGPEYLHMKATST